MARSRTVARSLPFGVMNRERLSFGPRVPLLLVLVAMVGLAYEALLVFTSVLTSYRFPIPYAVPLFDIPFVLVATGIAYLCLERHRIRQDFQSAAMGTSPDGSGVSGRTGSMSTELKTPRSRTAWVAD